MSPEKKSLKRKTVTVPKDRAEMEQFVARIREEEEKINAMIAETAGEFAAVAARMNDIKKGILEKTKPIEHKIEGLAEGVFIFASGSREELTDHNMRKTVEFITGDKIQWYYPPTSVVAENEEAAIAELERRGLSEFIRVKKEINREAILQEPKKAKGLRWISLSQDEIFAIVPAKMDFELQKGKRKFKKVKLA